MEYGYQGIDPGSKAQCLLNGIRCDKLSTAVAAVKMHLDKYEKDFDAVISFLSQYIKKGAPTMDIIHWTELTTLNYVEILCVVSSIC